jgi:hypothetical protein
MQDRPLRLKLPSFYPPSAGTMIFEKEGKSKCWGPDETLPLARDQAAPLIDLLTDLLELARILANPYTPRTAGHVLFEFRPRLDRLVNRLNDWYGTELGIHFPVNFPIAFRVAGELLAETVQQLQDWDAKQKPGQPIEPLPQALLTTLGEVLSKLVGLSAEKVAMVEDGDLDEGAYLDPRDWARLWSLPQKALEARLKRWRQEHPEEAGRGWIEANDRGPKQAQYLYRRREIRHILEALRASGIRRAK